MRGPLAQALLGAVRAELAPSLEARSDLEPRLQSIVTAAREAWPALDVRDADFVAHLGGRIRDAAALDAAPDYADLYLSFACLRGLASAVTEVEARARVQASRAARRLRLTADEAQDLVQQMLAAVLVGDEGTPGIAGYAGQGPLDAWLAAVAYRIGLRRRGQARRETPDGSAEAKADGWEQADPELDFIKKRYREHFDTAFRQALGALSPRDKNVLRLYLDGLNIERIGVCYGVHRATVARWIGDARERLLGDTRARLASELQLEASEVDSLVGLLKSQVEVSLLKYLVTSGG